MEFALVVPMLLLMVFGTIQYGFYFWAMQGGPDMTRRAVRFASVSKPAGCPAFVAAVNHQVNGFAAAQDVPDTTVTRTYKKGPGNISSSVEVGDLVMVTVTFKSTDIGLGGLLPFIEHGLVTQSAEARVDYLVAVPPGNCP